MKNRQKRLQRQEVRKLLDAMRKELKNYRLQYEDLPDAKRPVMHLNELMQRAASREE